MINESEAGEEKRTKSNQKSFSGIELLREEQLLSKGQRWWQLLRGALQ